MDYDFIVIGGGSGGYSAAIRAAQLGSKVAIIEKSQLGGACLNWGCIPTKTLYRNAEVLKIIKSSEEYGIKIDNYELDISKIQERKQKVINKLVIDIERKIIKYNISLYRGTGKIVDSNTVEVSLEDNRYKEIKGKYIIIATGSRPIMPPMDGYDLDGVLNSSEILSFNAIPKSLTIIGGGVVGMEFCSIFSALGSEVNVICSAECILGRVDKDLTKELEIYLKEDGVNIVNHTRASRIEKIDDETLRVYGNKGGEEVSVDSEKVLIAIGRKPNSENIGLEEVGIITERGAIVIDDDYKTNIDNIYAIGDVNKKIMLAYAASHQAIHVIESIMGIEEAKSENLFASCIFVFPELSFVGMTEEEVKQKNIKYKTNKFNFESNGKALALNESKGIIKVIADDENKILGVHILGPHATDLIHEAVLAMNKNMNIDDVINTIHAHPTLSEAFKDALVGLREDN